MLPVPSGRSADPVDIGAWMPNVKRAQKQDGIPHRTRPRKPGRSSSAHREYDHSLMHDDFHPYYVRVGDKPGVRFVTMREIADDFRRRQPRA